MKGLLNQKTIGVKAKKNCNKIQAAQKLEKSLKKTVRYGERLEMKLHFLRLDKGRKYVLRE